MSCEWREILRNLFPTVSSKLPAQRPDFGLAVRNPIPSFNIMVNYRASPLDRTFGALADPTRRKILARLSRGDARVTDLARPFAMSLPAISRHIAVLERAGLLRRRRQGRVHHLKLESAPIRHAARWIDDYRRFWEGSLDSLAAYLERGETKAPITKKSSS
jgi:DNA-binding transcriptional ArsR family regulator